MAIGRVPGPALYQDLDRQGFPLQFTTDGQSLVYMDFAQFRLGVNTDSPNQELHVVGNAQIGNLVFANNTITSLTGKIDLGSNANVKLGGGVLNQILASDGAGNVLWVEPQSVFELGDLIANTIQLGANSAGKLASNATTLTTTTTVTNGIAIINEVLGKLVPPAPPNFPNAQTLSVNSLTSYRMCNFTQTDNTANTRSVAGGTTVSVRRLASYSTTTIANTGPGDSGTITAYLNGVAAGNVTLTGSSNGTYGNLVITNNTDYRNINPNIAAGFWSVVSASLSGTALPGWNDVAILHSGVPAGTNTAAWYYDNSSPGTPQLLSGSISPTTVSLTYSSTVPHYNSSTQFTYSITTNRLSGDTYPTSDTFFTGSAGGAFAAPASRTYAQAGITTPLARNLYVSSGNIAFTTTANITTGFGNSSTGFGYSITNSYSTLSGTQSPSAFVLFKTGTANAIEETSVVVTSVGTGSGNAYRILNPGSTDTPAYTANATAFNSTSSTLTATDATIVGAILRHDVTNYSTGYLPAGPNLSSGRSGAQYFTMEFVRTVVSKFDITWSGNIAGLWVALPGSTIDSTSTLNGWLDCSVAYAGAGVPGANTGAGGNGSNGCALGGVAPLNSVQTNRSITVTFGTVSSSSTVTNEIYVRIKLTSGQTVTALSMKAASN